MYSSRSRGTVVLLALAVVVAMLAAILLAAQIAEAKGGGGGGGRGGGGSSGVSSGKPYGSSNSSKPSNGSSTGNASANKGLPSGVANPSSPYYNSPRYGARYHNFSNFLLWSWAFHGVGYGDDDNDELYEEEYIEPNYDFGGWALSGVGLVGIFFLVRALWKRTNGQPTYSPAGSTTSSTSPEKGSAGLFDPRSH